MFVPTKDGGGFTISENVKSLRVRYLTVGAVQITVIIALETISTRETELGALKNES